MRRSAPVLSSARKIVPLTMEYAPAAVTCIAESFHHRAVDTDPFSLALNLRKHHWEKMGNMFVQRAAQDTRRLSVVAINEETGRVDGVMVNEDWKTPQPAAYRQLNSDSWRPVRAAFHKLHNRFKAEHTHIAENQMLHSLYFTCVHPDARYEGVMKALWQMTLRHARDFNFRYLVAEASRDSVRSIFEDKLGLKEVARVDFDEFKFEGVSPFAELHDDNPDFNALTIHRRKVPSDLY